MTKTPEDQETVSTTQDAENAQTNDAQQISTTQAQSSSSSAGEKKLKKPHHLKLFNCLMKPSLSLTSLPPQSPKEVSDEAQSVERPYNSLKVSKFVCFWGTFINDVKVLIINVQFF